MADITTGFALNASRRGAVRAWFARLGAGFGGVMERMIERQSRQGQIDALMALSDEDLAARGLRRDDIPRYVFRDLFYM